MEITYDYYRIFYFVANNKSISQAARALNCNQPNITKTIKTLEGQLHCKLFVRSSRGVTLTPEGQKLYTHVKIAYEHIRKAEMELIDDKTLKAGLVTISCCESALHGVMVPILQKFHSLYPGIRVCITNISTSQAIQVLGSGISDFAVVSAPTSTISNFKATPLLTFRDQLIGSPKYSHLCKKSLNYENILRYPLIGLGSNTLTYDFYKQLCAKQGLTWAPSIEVGTINQILSLIEADLGIGFVPSFLVRKELEEEKVVSIPLTLNPPERKILLIEDTRSHLSKAALTFKKMLIDNKL